MSSFTNPLTPKPLAQTPSAELSVTERPELILELLATLPPHLPKEQQRRIVQNILSRKSTFDPETLVGELAWQKRDLMSSLEKLASEEEQEQTAITAQIETLWNQRDQVQETYTQRSEEFQNRVAQLDRVLSFLLGEEVFTPKNKSEPEPFFNLIG
jgi:hypothetical protein